jgi:hypothetical protein
LKCRKETKNYKLGIEKNRIEIKPLNKKVILVKLNTKWNIFSVCLKHFQNSILILNSILIFPLTKNAFSI